MTTKITISKKWNSPHIKTTVDHEGIGLQTDLEDFIIALKQEMGSITWTFKKDTFEKMLDEAIQKVLKGIKEESVKVIK
jgi:hypothetical protein